MVTVSFLLRPARLVLFLTVALSAACGGGGGSGGSNTGTAPQPTMVEDPTPPNFIFVVLDDWGWRDYGEITPGIVTPNIDSIARSGFSFDNAFLTTSSCSPSRASILMGRYPYATGGPHLHDGIPQVNSSIPEQLRDAGYYTAAAGKWHLGGAFKPRFEVVHGASEDSEAVYWADVLNQRPADKPFFLWLASYDPHVPHEAPEGAQLHNPDELTMPEYLVDTPAGRVAYAAYLDEVTLVDQAVGQLMNELEAQDLLASTWVFVLADNGAPTPFGKTTLYDSGIKTPLLIMGPAGSGSYPGLVSTVDLAPTVIELAGISPVEEFQGRSFMRAFDSSSYVHREFVYAEQNNHGGLRGHTAVRSKDFLMIRNYYYTRYCASEMGALWRDIVVASQLELSSVLQRMCVTEQPALQFFEVGEPGYEQDNRAGEFNVAEAQNRHAQALEEWEQTYRKDACKDIECARAEDTR